MIFITKAKLSCAPWDTHKSKLVTILHFSNFGKTYSCFVFSTKLKQHFEKNIFQRRKGHSRTQTLKCQTILVHSLKKKIQRRKGHSRTQMQGMMFHLNIFHEQD